MGQDVTINLRHCHDILGHKERKIGDGRYYIHECCKFVNFNFYVIVSTG